MDTKKITGTLFLILSLTTGAPLAGFAQGPQTGDNGLGVKLSLSAIEQFEADVGDSKVDVSRYQVKADIDLVKSRKMLLKLGSSYGVSDYGFSGPPADPWSDPWGEIRSADIGLSLILPGSGRWSYFLASSLDWSWEEGADTSDGLAYGIIASTSRNFRMDRRLGFGVGVFEGLEETKVFPYAVVSWKLGDKLTLQNPLSAGPAGPAGLELSWETAEKWQVGTGAAYRSFRFRLDDDGIAPGGVGEMTGVPVWVRASWQSSLKSMMHLYTGTILAGEVTLENSGGRELESKHLDPAHLVGIVFDLSL